MIMLMMFQKFQPSFALLRVWALVVALSLWAASEKSFAQPIQWVNGQAADIVIGQTDFTSAAEGVSQTKFGRPHGIAIDRANGKLYLADANNNRVLRFAYPIVGNFPAAEAVFGQVNFTANLPNQGGSPGANTLAGPVGLAVRNGDLWVADRENRRVLRFAAAHTLGNNPSATNVLGQVDFTALVNVVTQNNIPWPYQLEFDHAGNLYVSDNLAHRVLRFNAADLGTNGANANLVLGQADFTTPASSPALNRMQNPTDLALDANGNLFVSQFGGHRIFRFDNVAAIATNGPTADGILGTGISGSTNTQLNQPAGLATDGGDLYCCDLSNSRIVIWRAAATKPNGAPIDHILGKTAFNVTTQQTTRSGMNRPYFLALDATPGAKRIIAGDFNNRLLQFSEAPLAQLSGVQPPRGAHTASRTSSITIPFNRPLASNASAEQFRVHRSMSGNAGTVSAQGASATITLSPPLFPGERVFVTATSAQASLEPPNPNGAPMAAGRVVADFRAQTSPSQGDFLYAGRVGSGNWSARPALADFNNDGNLDMAVAINSSNIIQVFLGDGRGGFTLAAVVPAGTDEPWHTLVGDFNNDGFMDIANAESSNVFPNKANIFLGNGTGSSFMLSGTIAHGNNTQWAFVADFNNDGNLDIIKYNSSSSPPNATVCLGNGAGAFLGFIPLPNYRSRYAVADFNGDGNLDFIGDAQIHLGNGSGGFGSIPLTPAAWPWNTGDLNNDGHLDIASQNLTNITVHFGNGAGGFPSTAVISPGINLEPRQIADVNGDGLMDIIAIRPFPGQRFIHVFLNNGNGTSYTERILEGVNQYINIALGDIDNDGDLDILAGGATGFPGVEIFRNESRPALRDFAPPRERFNIAPQASVSVGFTLPVTSATALASSSPSGAISVFASQSGRRSQGAWSYDAAQNLASFAPQPAFRAGETAQITVSTAASSPSGARLSQSFVWSFTVAARESPATFFPGVIASSSSSSAFLPRHTAAADVNGDGRLDVIAALASGGFMVALNEGEGRYKEPERFGEMGEKFGRIAVGDFNGDGRPDILAALDGAAGAAHFRNIGGGFERAGNVFTGQVGRTSDIAVADFDGDGWQDALVVSEGAGGGFALLVNRAGTLVSESNLANSLVGFLTGAVPIDFDGDGDMDAIAARGETGQVLLLRNVGGGRFNTETLVSFAGERVVAARAADFSGDGAPDIVVVTANPSGGAATVRILRALPSGALNPNAKIIPLGASASDVVVFDADGDGDADIVVLQANEAQALVLLNVTGDFAVSGAFPLESSSAGSPPMQTGGGLGFCAGDFDGDGDIDIAAPHPAGGLNILYNAPEPTTFSYRGDAFGGDAARPSNWAAVTPYFTARASSFLRAGSVFVVPSASTATAQTSFTLGEGATLRIERGAALIARGGVTLRNSSGTISVQSGGRLRLEDDGKITETGVRYESPDAALEYAGVSPRIIETAELPQPFPATLIIKNTGGVSLPRERPTTQVAGTLILGEGALKMDGRNLQISGALICTNGSITPDGARSLIIDGAGAIRGALTTASVAVGTFLFDRAQETLRLGSPLEIETRLTLGSGVIVSDSARKLRLKNPAPEALAVSSATAFVSGPVAWRISPETLGMARRFPVGKIPVAAPFSLSALRLSSPPPPAGAYLEVEAFLGAPPEIFVDSTLLRLQSLGYWAIGINGVSAAEATVVASAPPSLGVAPDAVLALRRRGESVFRRLKTARVGTTLQADSAALPSVVAFAEPMPPPIPAVRIANFSPTSGDAQTIITVRGENFIGVSQVLIGTLPVAEFQTISPTELRVRVGAAETGEIFIRTARNGSVSSTGQTFRYLGPPVIFSLSPRAVALGEAVVIRGANFLEPAANAPDSLIGDNTGIAEKRLVAAELSGVRADSLELRSPNELIARFFAPAADGRLRLWGAHGSATAFDSLVVQPPPRIDGLSRATASTGETIVVTGANFLWLQSVRLGAQSLWFTALSADSLLVRLPLQPATDILHLRGAGGATSSSVVVRVNAPPQISLITPLNALVGEAISILGERLETVESITLGGAPAYFIVDSALGRIRAIVPRVTPLPVAARAELVAASQTHLTRAAQTLTVIPTSAPAFTGFAPLPKAAAAPSALHSSFHSSPFFSTVRGATEGTLAIAFGVNFPARDSGLASNANFRLNGVTVSDIELVSSTHFIFRVPFGVAPLRRLSTEATMTFGVGDANATFAALPLRIDAANAPRILDFSPRIGGEETRLVILGENLQSPPRGGVQEVRVGGVSFQDFFASDSVVIVSSIGTISAVRSRLPVRLVTPMGEITAAGDFEFIPALRPYIPVSARDSLALLRFAVATAGIAPETPRGTLWTTNANWGQTDVSAWAGVRLANGRVTEISLPANNLIGTAATLAALAELDALRVLNLADNNLVGEVPPEIQSLQNLVQLRLAGNFLQGSPALFTGGLSALEDLDLSGNRWNGDLSWLGALPNLKRLRLDSCGFSGELSLRALPPRLEQLSLNANRIAGLLPDSLFWRAPELRELSLRDNRLRGRLPALWGDIRRANADKASQTKASFAQNDDAEQNNDFAVLERLDLSGNELEGEIPPQWGSFINARYISLARNGLEGAVPAEFSRLLNLRALDIAENRLSRLPDLTVIRRLDTLYADNNRLEFSSLEPNADLRVTRFHSQALVEIDSTLVTPLDAVGRIQARIGGRFTAYQWLKDGAAIGGELSGEEGGETLIIAPVSQSDSGKYECLARSGHPRLASLRLRTSLALLTTSAAQAPSKSPRLLLPDNRAEELSLRPIFTCSAVDDAVGYELEIATDSLFRGEIVRLQTAQTPEIVRRGFARFPPPDSLEGLRTYYWRARAVASLGASPYSEETRAFTTAQANAPLSLQPLDFGVVARGDTAVAQVRLKNISGRALLVYAVEPALSPYFSVPAFGAAKTLAANDSLDFEAFFHPTRAANILQSDVAVEYALEGAATRQRFSFPRRLSGEGSNFKIVPPTVDTVFVGRPTIGVARLINRGEQQIKVREISLENAQISDYALDESAQELRDAVLRRGEERSFTVRFAPRAEGLLAEQRVRVAFDDAGGDTPSSVAAAARRFVLQSFARALSREDVVVRLGLRAIPERAAPGSSVVLELYIDSGMSARLKERAAPVFFGAVRLNPRVILPNAGGILRPERAEGSSGAGALERFTLTPSFWNFRDSILARIEARALAGSVDTSALIIDYMIWDKVVVGDVVGGGFRSLLSRAGGERRIAPASLQNFAPTILSVSPNPVSDEVEIVFSFAENDGDESITADYTAGQTVAGQTAVGALILLDASGKEAAVFPVDSQFSSPRGARRKSLSLKGFPAGAYILQVKDYRRQTQTSRRINIMR